MGLLNKLKNTLLGTPKNISPNFVPHEPLFIKEYSKTDSGLEELVELSDKLIDSSKKERITRDIFYLKKGLSGEQKVAFELNHSFLPLTCFHNLRIQYGNYAAQIDFLIVTDRFIAVLETKKLSGNIEINSDGDFIRLYQNKRNGMYSPVSQNTRHINILKYLISQELSTVSLPPIYSLVVLANDNSVINMAKAPQSIKDIIIKRDSLVDKLTSIYKSSTSIASEGDIKRLSDAVIHYDTPIQFNYMKKYSLGENDFAASSDFNRTAVKTNSEENTNIQSSDSDDLFEKLRTYRNSKAKEKGYDYKRYHYIFPNSVIEKLLESMPSTKEELFKIPGLGDTRIEKYGSDLLNIINQSTNISSVDSSQEVACTKSISLKDELKQYRLDTSKALKIKPYLIFNNKEMEALIIYKPTTIESLKNIKVINNMKCENYGDKIIEIIKKHK